MEVVVSEKLSNAVKLLMRQSGLPSSDRESIQSYKRSVVFSDQESERLVNVSGCAFTAMLARCGRVECGQRDRR